MNSVLIPGYTCVGWEEGGGTGVHRPLQHPQQFTLKPQLITNSWCFEARITKPPKVSPTCVTVIAVSETWSSPADNKTAVILRELRAVKRLEHLNLLLDAVQLISGVLQLDNLHSPQPQKTQEATAFDANCSSFPRSSCTADMANKLRHTAPDDDLTVEHHVVKCYGEGHHESYSSTIQSPILDKRSRSNMQAR